MRETRNPVFRSLPKQRGGYAQFGGGTAAAQQIGYGYQGQQVDPYSGQDQRAAVGRPLTIDDVVTKTGTTLGVLSLVAVVSYFVVLANPTLAGLFAYGGGFAGLGLVMYGAFKRKFDSKALVLSYAALEGLFLGSVSYLMTNVAVLSSNAGAMIGQAVLGTLGVFAGMLVVYKTGAIRVTPKAARMAFAMVVGAFVLMLGNLFLGMFGVGGAEGPLRNGGPLAILFSLACIAIAAYTFLIDFDAADQMIRAGAPERAAWGIALGLTVTLVWLYLEILRLLSYVQSD